MESDQLLFELQSAIKPLLKRLRTEPQFAIKEACFKRAAVQLQPSLGLYFRSSSNPSRFQSPTWRQPWL
jgi:hypothetical protein